MRIRWFENNGRYRVFLYDDSEQAVCLADEKGEPAAKNAALAELDRITNAIRRHEFKRGP